MRGLPYSLYLDPSRAPQEAAAIFASSWQFVCHVSDLPAPGTAARFDCAGRSAVVLRTRSGELQAFRNACRHRGARLVEGDAHTGLAFCVDGRLRCPYHGWTYDDTGALVARPEAQQFDADFDPAQHALVRAHAAQWRGLVFVAFESPRESLSAALRDVAPDWPDLAPLRRLIEPRSLVCPADWKLAVEHLLDTAHAGVARPGSSWNVFAPPQFTVATAAALHAGAVPAAERPNDAWSARASRDLLHRMPPAPAGFAFLWPNTLLQFSADGLVVLQVLPVATGVSAYRESRYALPDTTREMQLLRYLQRRVRRQGLQADARLLARVQQGMSAGLEPGPIAASEPGLRWFAARYREQMAGHIAPEPGPPAPRRARTKRRTAVVA